MKRWYVVHVYAGYEDAVCADIQGSIKKKGLEDHFGQVLVPSTKMKQFFSAEDSKDQQLFPGYILVEMEMLPETKRFIDLLPRVVRFLGGEEPVPLSSREIDRIISQVKGEIVVASDDSDFTVGREIEIKDGPFAGFVGIIDAVNKDAEKLTVMVSIFGRMTPVELRFDQIKR